MDWSSQLERFASPPVVARGFVWFELDPDGGTVRSGAQTWRPGANEARCHLYPRFLWRRWRALHPSGVPGASCRCGFGATFRPEPAGLLDRVDPATSSGSGRQVVGVVHGWGRVVTEDRGWRSAYALVAAFHAAPAALEDADAVRRLDMAARLYGVPLIRDYNDLVRLGHPSSLPAA